MGFESEIVQHENDAYTHIVFDGYGLYHVNSDDDNDDDDEFWEMYDDISKETPYDVEYNWYEEDADIPGLIPSSKLKKRHTPWVWYSSYMARQ